MIKNIVIDLDGTLTDGRQHITEDGEKLFKVFHARDRQTVRRLLGQGYRIIVISADDWPGAKSWAHTLGHENGRWVEFVHLRDKHELDIDWSATLGCADDYSDALFLEKCAIALCPADADYRLHHRRLKVNGGQAIMEHIERELQPVTYSPEKPKSNAVLVGTEFVA